MSDTIIDFAKVAQMLDAGWQVRMHKWHATSYAATATHPSHAIMQDRRRKLTAISPLLVDDDGEITTDDFTPEQCLTRLAYKVLGEVI